MDSSRPTVEIVLRIPGRWEHPGELIQRMPVGYRLTPDRLLMPDGSGIEFIPRAPDDQFFQIFRSSCRQAPTELELECIRGYTVNICLAGPGGSLESALKMLQAGAAIVRAGGAGVFIDNSGLAHGGHGWIDMSDDGSSDALSFAYVSVVSGRQHVRTAGMHVLGLPDITMSISSPYSQEGESIIEILRYMCATEHPVGDGHLLADESGLRWKAVVTTPDDLSMDHPMHNPFGRLKLVSVQGSPECN